MQATTPMVAAAVVSVAIAAGCGGSSNEGKASTATTRATQSTQTTSTTATTSDTGHVAKSAHIASTAYYNFALAVTHNTASYLSANQAKFAAHCIQSRFLAAGYKTQADVEKAGNSEKVHEILTTCFLKGQDH